jgi:hypothetical protein
MSARYEKLVQCSQSTQQFISVRIDQDRVFTEVAKELVSISNSLQTGKLTIEIFSNVNELSQGLYNFLNTRNTLPQFYHVKISQLNLSSQQTAQANLPPALVLQANSANAQQQVRYELSNQQDVLIGRDQQRLQQNSQHQNVKLIALPAYSKVSSVHAKIQTTASQSPGWQMCDLDSTNGTYINGERVRGCKVLQSGDKITLAYPSISERSPEFIFNCQPTATIANQQSAQSLDCDLVCLVINPKQLLTDAEKELIEQASRATIVGLIVIADTSVSSNSLPQITANLANIDNWIKQQYPKLSYELAQLALYPFCPSAANFNITIDSVTQQNLDKFCEPLAYLGKNKALDVLANRLNLKLLLQIQRLEKFISDLEVILNRDLQQTDEMLRGRFIEDYQMQVRQAFRKVNEAREDFFRSARIELGRSTRDQATSFIPNSLLQKISEFIATLDPAVIRKDKQVYIQLQVPNASDTHTAILSFCRNEVLTWATAEWNKVYYSHEGEGLNGLQQKSYTALNCLPSLTLPFPFSQSIPKVDMWEGIQSSFVEIKNNTSYFEGSSGTFGGVARLGVQAAITAGMAIANPVSALIQSANLAVGMASLVGSTLSRPKIQSLKLEQAIEGIKQNACNNYQNIARYLLERVAQNVNLALDAEERRFRKALETVDEQSNEHLQIVKGGIDAYRKEQQALSQDRAFIDQLKRSLS